MDGRHEECVVLDRFCLLLELLSLSCNYCV